MHPRSPRRAPRAKRGRRMGGETLAGSGDKAPQHWRRFVDYSTAMITGLLCWPAPLMVTGTWAPGVTP